MRRKNENVEIVERERERESYTLKTRRKEKGITLVALVVTIVILIILATVSMGAIFGDKGLIKQAEYAKDLSANSTKKEEESMANLAEYMNEVLGGDGGGQEEDKTPPTVEIATGEITDTSIAVTVNAVDDSGEIAKYIYNINGKEPQESTTNTYKYEGLTAGTEYTIKVEAYDKANNKGEKTITASTSKPTPPGGVPIPDGFYYVGGTKNDGVVISDNPADEGKGTDHNTAQKVLQGNQFVWIPVEDDSKFKRYNGYEDGGPDTVFDYCTEPFANGYSTEPAEFDAMKASVEKNKGFYVGRYETGTNAKRTSNTGITDEAVIKQGKEVYNYIGWSNSDDMKNEKGGAVEKAKNFAKEHGYDEEKVTTTLVYGIEWDAIMNFIDPAYATESCDTSSSFVANSTGKGNYNEDANKNPWKGQVTTTGASSDYAVKNIYDLGGNVYEWTMEAVSANARVIRGRHLQLYRLLPSSLCS